jgi:phospholipase/carboxylesterase
MSLESITIPAENPQGLIVALHGWGANANDLASLAPYLKLSNYQFIFPNAPFPYPNSLDGKAWYDLRAENMYQGLLECREMLRDWLLSLEETTGISLSKTVLIGFSQGGAMTLDVGLKLPLAGLVSMSGYLHPDAIPPIKQDFPQILIMHGTSDRVVPLEAAQRTKQALKSLGVAVEYEEFNAEHEINMEMLERLRNFVVKVLP